MAKLNTSFVVFLLLVTGCDQSMQDRRQPAELFPPFLLTRLDGKLVPYDTYQGKTVIMNIWATWCAPCRKELPSLQLLSDNLDPEKYQVVGLSVDDDVTLVREYLIDRKIRFVNYIDQERRLTGDFLDIQAFPATLVISPDGIILHRVMGERDWAQDNVRTAIEAADNGDYQLLYNL